MKNYAEVKISNKYDAYHLKIIESIFSDKKPHFMIKAGLSLQSAV